MKAWLICVLCVSAFSGLTDILVPNGKSKKTFKAVSAIVLLCVLLYPLKNIDRNFYFYKFSFSNKEVSSSFQENYDEAALEIQTVYADILSDNVKGIYNTICNNVGVTGIEGTVDFGESDGSGEGNTDSEPDDSEGGSYDDEYSGDDSYDEYGYE